MTLLSTQPSKHDLLPLADAVAMMSHIREDYLSLSSSSASSSSSSFPGMTLPILHALQTSKDERIATILGNSGLNEQAAKRARKVMRDVTGSEAYTFKMLESLRGKVCELVEGLEGKERRLKMNCIL